MTPLTAPLPLRRTTAWPGFERDRIIPVRYGICTGSLLPYNAARTLWVWCDGPALAIDAVLVNGATVQGWQWRVGLDAAGAPVTFVEFSLLSAPAVGATVQATGRGRISTVTGALITNPADIVHDILANICGRSVEWSQLEQFRAESDSLGIICGGELASADAVHQVVRGVCASVGAIFHSLHPGLCQIWPGGSYVGRTHIVDGRQQDQEVSAVARLADSATTLEVAYAYVDGQPAATVDVVQGDTQLPARRVTLGLPFVQHQRVAYDVGARVLAHRSRVEPWAYRVSNVRGIVRPGDRLAISAGTVPAATATVLRSSISYEQQVSTVEAES